MTQKTEELNQQEIEVQDIPVNNQEEDRVKPAELVLSAEKKNGYEEKVASLEDGDARKVLAKVIQLIEQRMGHEQAILKQAFEKAPAQVLEATGVQTNAELSEPLAKIQEQANKAASKLKGTIDSITDPQASEGEPRDTMAQMYEAMSEEQTNEEPQSEMTAQQRLFGETATALNEVKRALQEKRGERGSLSKALAKRIKAGEDIATILEDEKVLARLEAGGQTVDDITPLLEEYKTKYDQWHASAEIDQLKTEQPVENTAQNKEAAEQPAETSAEVALDSRQIQGILDAAEGYVAGIKNKSIRRKAEMALGGLSANADPDTVFPAVKRALGIPSSTSDARFLQRISRLRVDALQDQISNSNSENARRQNDSLNREINAVLERSKRLGDEGVSDDEVRAIYTGQDNPVPPTSPSGNTGSTPAQSNTQQRSRGVSMQRRFGKAHEPREHTTDVHVGKTTLPLGETKDFKPGDQHARRERLVSINRTEQQTPAETVDQSPEAVVDTEPLEPLKPQEQQPVMWTESEQEMHLKQAQQKLEYWQDRVNESQERITNAGTEEEKVKQSKILQTHLEQVAHYEAAVAEAQRVVNEVPAGSDVLPNESPVEKSAPEEFTAEDVDRTTASVSEVAESVAGEQASQVVENETVNDTENEDLLDSIHPEALMFKPTAADSNIDGRQVIEYYIQNTTTTDKLSKKELVDALLQYKQEGANGMGQFATEHIMDDQMTKITSALDSAYHDMLTEQKAESASAEI